MTIILKNVTPLYDGGVADANIVMVECPFKGVGTVFNGDTVNLQCHLYVNI